jgi:hypothetical protein
MIQQTVFPFKLEVTRENLTAHGGLALMAEFNRGTGLRDLVDRHLPSPRSNRGFSPSMFVEVLVLMLQAGGRSLEDVRELKSERGLMELMGCKEVPGPDTVGDWLRRMGSWEGEQLGLKGLDRVREGVNRRILRNDDRQQYTLDVDATEIVAGKFEALFTYKGNKGYMPCLGFLFELDLCIYDEFREGNVPPAYGQREFYIECKKRMPRGKRIKYYRADSASYQADLINDLERDGVKYTITADQDSAVRALISLIPERQWKEPCEGCGYEVADAVHCMSRTREAFRLVIKRERRRGQLELFDEGGGYIYHVIATNWLEEEKDGWQVLQWHNGRGQAENFIKELKNGFGMERMPCGQSCANAVFFRIGVIAYNLFVGFRLLSCHESLAKHTIATFRWKLFQVAGRIVRHAGRIILKLAIEVEKLVLFKRIRELSYEIGSCFS